jgi:hypothetical protein
MLVTHGSAGAAVADETSGAPPGSAEATVTIDGRYLPPPLPFQGEINLNAAQSKPAWLARVVPPKENSASLGVPPRAGSPPSGECRLGSR